MEQKRKGSYYAKLIFSILFVIVMFVIGAYGVYKSADNFILYKSKQYQTEYGYLQQTADVENTMINGAKAAISSAIAVASGNTDTNVEDYSLEGIHQIVTTGKYYFAKEKGTEEIKRSTGDAEINPDTFLADKYAGFYYDGKKAWMKYSDGTMEKYEDADALEAIDTEFSKLTSNFSYTDLTVYTWVDDEIYKQQNVGLYYLDNWNETSMQEIIIAFSIAGVCFVLAALFSVRSKKGMERKKQIATEIPLVMLGADGILGVACIARWGSGYGILDYYNKNIRIAITVGICVMVLLAFLVCRECVLKIKERRFFKDALIIRSCRWVGRKCRNGISILVKKSHYEDFPLSRKLWIRKCIFILCSMLYVLPVVTAFEGAKMIFFLGIYGVAFLIYNIYEMMFLKSLNDVYNQVEDIAKGEYGIRDVDKKDLTYNLVELLNGLSGGMEEAVEKRLSSEKMKVELITNVSHDLKTPLTSIISYVNLLKEEEMSEVASAYVKILEDKSYQLKNIVADVFDLAKANSGQDVEIETIDGIILIHQVLADMNDTIERSGRLVKTDIKPDTFFIKGDGKKLYRAIQNLLDNALKYSMEGTRIFVNSGVEEDKLKLEIKNIAAYEMDFSGEDIVERFVRGDESRTTEGSGLGLSIAKSFIEVSGGSMKVEVDGDLFKVTVEF